MKSDGQIPSRKEAEDLITWANEQNPGPWIAHSRVVGRAAEEIAQKCRLDKDRAYISGLLHDIGYYSYRDGRGEKDHIFAGYDLMMNNSYDVIAKICLSHSFSYQDAETVPDSWITCSDEEMMFITTFLTETTYDDYDKLIQLCDALCLPQGVVMMEKRLVDVVMRKGFRSSTLKKWDAWFSLKNYFDKLCGTNIYTLFYDEINTSIFGI